MRVSKTQMAWLLAVAILSCTSAALGCACQKHEDKQLASSILTWGGTGDDRAYDVTVDSEMGTVICGRFQGSVDFNPGAAWELRASNESCGYVLVLSQDLDFYWVQTDISGDLLGWTADPPAVWAGSEIKLVDSHDKGLIFVAGRIFVRRNPSARRSCFGAFLMALDREGETLWVMPVFGERIGLGAITTDPSGNVLFSYSKALSAEGEENTPADYRPSYAAFVAKVNGQGQSIWSLRWDDVEIPFVKSLAADSKGCIYICGQFSGSVDFDPDPARNELIVGSGISSHLTKLSPEGSHLWTRTWESSGTTKSNGIAVDTEGSVYITGEFFGPTRFGGADSDSSPTEGLTDAFLSKFTSEGQYEWTKTWGGALADRGLDLVIDQNGIVHVIGEFNPSRLSLLGLAQSVRPVMYRISSEGDFIDREGSVFASPSVVPTALAADDHGQVYIVGYFSDRARFSISNEDSTYLSNGDFDAFELLLRTNSIE